jgi:hypothetical protein
MTTKTKTPNDNEKPDKIAHPGMMGDGTEEQNLNEPGNQAARISKNEVKRAFSKPRPAR